MGAIFNRDRSFASIPGSARVSRPRTAFGLQKESNNEAGLLFGAVRRPAPNSRWRATLRRGRDFDKQESLPQTKGVVNSLRGFFGVGEFDDDADLDLAGGDHVDVDAV